MIEKKLRLVVIGISHNTASISDLESFQINRSEMGKALHNIFRINEVNGIVIVSTCNRVEFYLSLSKEINPFPIINNFYNLQKNIDVSKTEKSFYVRNNNGAATHLFKVVCGLDSMVLGEYQVQGQIKESYSLACSEKTADKLLHKLFHAAFRVGKSVRSKTKIGSVKQSVSGVACQLMKEKLDHDDAIAIIGVNQNTSIIAEKLKRAKFSDLIFINRTLYKAQKLANQFSGRAFGFNRMESALSGAKCIFSCTGAPDFVITSEMLKRITGKANNLNLIIDIAIPRDIDTGNLSGKIEVFDLDGLKTRLINQEKEIALDLPIIEKIILEETRIFEAWSESQSDETIAYYDEKLEYLRQQILDETKESISGEEFQLLEKFSRSLLHRLKSTIHQIVKTGGFEKKAI